jgi:hypothetical protein
MHDAKTAVLPVQVFEQIKKSLSILYPDLSIYYKNFCFRRSQTP